MRRANDGANAGTAGGLGVQRSTYTVRIGEDVIQEGSGEAKTRREGGALVLMCISNSLASSHIVVTVLI